MPSKSRLRKYSHRSIRRQCRDRSDEQSSEDDNADEGKDCVGTDVSHLRRQTTSYGRRRREFFADDGQEQTSGSDDGDPIERKQCHSSKTFFIDDEALETDNGQETSSIGEDEWESNSDKFFSHTKTQRASFRRRKMFSDDASAEDDGKETTCPANAKFSPTVTLDERALEGENGKEIFTKYSSEQGDDASKSEDSEMSANVQDWQRASRQVRTFPNSSVLETLTGGVAGPECRPDGKSLYTTNKTISGEVVGALYKADGTEPGFSWPVVAEWKRNTRAKTVSHIHGFFPERDLNDPMQCREYTMTKKTTRNKTIATNYLSVYIPEDPARNSLSNRIELGKAHASFYDQVIKRVYPRNKGVAYGGDAHTDRCTIHLGDLLTHEDTVRVMISVFGNLTKEEIVNDRQLMTLYFGKTNVDTAMKYFSDRLLYSGEKTKASNIAF